MIQRFEIKSTHGPVLKFKKSSEKVDSEGWGTFEVSLENAPMIGSVEISDLDPNRWSSFFKDISDNWRGWKGIKTQGSIEEDLIITAKSDSTGHIDLRVEFNSEPGGADWYLAGTLTVEAGALEGIAKAAKKFFIY